MSNQQFLVAQLGGRMQYAVPRILHSAGVLQRLYTDFCMSEGWLSVLLALPHWLQPEIVRRAVGRCPRGIPHSKICGFNSFGYRYMRRQRAAITQGEALATYLWAGAEFCSRILKCGLGDATGVYSFNSAGLELLRAARLKGRLAVLEQTIAPMSIESEILQAESQRFPGWTTGREDTVKARAYAMREAAEWEAADLILCGSDFVRESVIRCGGMADKCVVVPYGVDVLGGNFRNSHTSQNGARQLRVLTVGTVGLRKGSPYVLEAARQLESRAQFRMVGTVQVPLPAREALRACVDLVGAVPLSEVKRHFEWADVFLLPSLCEGSATVVYEALALGLPVICTPNTGSVIRDGIDGFIVPNRDPEAIVGAISRLAQDHGLLAWMGSNARERATQFTVERYGQRLLAALRLNSNCG